jgi:hypothetical protein
VGTACAAVAAYVAGVHRCDLHRAAEGLGKLGHVAKPLWAMANTLGTTLGLEDGWRCINGGVGVFVLEG